MPRFEPFRGLRYDPAAVRLDDVIAPPYDVIDEAERHRLEDRPYNSVRLELPRDYDEARCLLDDWRAEKVLALDDRPAFYVYRMDFTDEAGRPASTTGVIGALGLEDPDAILPHEHTTPKAKTDRLELLRTCEANLSPIWVLSPTAGLAAACRIERPPDATAADDEGVVHHLWRADDDPTVAAIAGAVGANAVIVADGHHRYEVAQAYRAERPGGGPQDAVMALAVELADDQLHVGAVHRLVTGLPPELDVAAALADDFELAASDDLDDLVLVTPAGRWRLRPRPALDAAAGIDLDSARVATALGTLPDHELVYQHGRDNILAAVAAGRAQAGILLRPVTVAQIAEVGRSGARMPPKTTFFSPKPRTGFVFRSLRD